MLIELKPQLFPTDMNGLQRLVREQEARLANLNKLITVANDRIDALRKAAAPPPRDISAQERQILKSVTDRQLVSQIGEIRRGADAELAPLVKAAQTAADDAKVMGERHWDKHSIFRKAKSGNVGVQGILEATQLRAAYADILAVTGPTELARWAQQAIDNGDPILADAVLRENGARKRDEQSFATASLLERVPNAEYEQAQALLSSVIDLAARAGLAYSEFQRQAPDAFRRIQLGLRAQQKIKEAGIDDAGAGQE